MFVLQPRIPSCVANDIYGGKHIMAGRVYRRIRASFCAVAMTAMTFTVAACGGGGDAGGPAVSAPAAVGSVNVTLANAQLQVGAQQTATAEVRSTASAVLTGRAGECHYGVRTRHHARH